MNLRPRVRLGAPERQVVGKLGARPARRLVRLRRHVLGVGEKVGRPRALRPELAPLSRLLVVERRLPHRVVRLANERRELPQVEAARVVEVVPFERREDRGVVAPQAELFERAAQLRPFDHARAVAVLQPEGALDPLLLDALPHELRGRRLHQVVRRGVVVARGLDAGPGGHAQRCARSDYLRRNVITAREKFLPKGS